MTFTEQDWKNIGALIAKAPITGAEAITVAILQQKISGEVASFHTPLAPHDPPSTEAV